MVTKTLVVGLAIAASTTTLLSAQTNIPAAPPSPASATVQKVSPQQLPSPEMRARIEERRQQIMLDRAKQMGMNVDELKGLSKEEKQTKMIEFFRKQREQALQRPALTNLQAQTFRPGNGLTPDKLKSLTPEQRQQMMKEAMEKRAAELEKKKKEGTLTPQEQMQLKSIENARAAHAAREQAKPSTPEPSKAEAKPAAPAK